MDRMPALVIYLNNFPVLGACDQVLNVCDGRGAADCANEQTTAYLIWQLQSGQTDFHPLLAVPVDDGRR